MKKFTLMLTTAMLGISASAQLYVCGNKVNGAMNWNPAEPVEVALVDGFYEFKAEGDFKMSTVIGTWNDFNGAAKGVSGEENSKWEVVSDTQSKAALVNWGDNTKPAKANEEVTYRVNAEVTEITATYSSSAVVNKVYLAGSFNSFDGADSNYQFSATEDDNVFKYEWEGEFSGNFKVVINGAWYGTRTPVVSGETYILGDTGNDNSTFAKTAIDPVFEININTHALTVTYTTNGDTPSDEQWYVIGGGFADDTNGWTVDHEMTKGENGTWTWTGNIHGEFKFRNAKNWDAEPATIVLGSTNTSAVETISGNGTFNLTNARDGQNFVIDGDDVTLTLDSTAKTLKVTGLGSTGVAAVEAANGEAVYFNMQGVRVANPENGLFIRVQNGKAVKVVK